MELNTDQRVLTANQSGPLGRFPMQWVELFAVTFALAIGCSVAAILMQFVDELRLQTKISGRSKIAYDHRTDAFRCGTFLRKPKG
jgi:hypothetical protein